MYKLLSYPLSARTPLYGDLEPVRIENNERPIGDGLTIRSARISFSNHSSTHIDAPAHFYRDGRTLSDHRIEELIFTDPAVIDCVKRDGELVMPEDLGAVPAGCDMIILRTGFFAYRNEARYTENNPGISPEAAEHIYTRFPSVRAIGIDAISISPYKRRDLGRRSHQILLKRSADRDSVLLIEDMDLSGELSGLKKVFAVPVLVENSDGMPCTVIGEF